MKKVFMIATLLLSGLIALPSMAGPNVNVVVDDLNSPWAVVASPDGNIWVTESEGQIRVFDLKFKELFSLKGFPELAAVGQGGLLDLAFHPEFSKNQWVYVAYTVGQSDWNTRVVRFKFDADQKRLTDPLVIINGPKGEDGAHFGCRLAFDSAGYLYASFGERHSPEKAQSLNELNGKIVRVNADGTIPQDNPFGGDNAIFTLGHRNPQGLDIEPATGRIFASEHGPTGYDGPGGGDEINWIRSGLNYGWPEISHSETKAGMETPLLQFTPAVAPSGIAFYTGTQIPEWTGNLFVATLRGSKLLRLKVDAQGGVSKEEELLTGFGRLRDVGNSPDGSLLVVSDMGELIQISK